MLLNTDRELVENRYKTGTAHFMVNEPIISPRRGGTQTIYSFLPVFSGHLFCRKLAKKQIHVVSSFFLLITENAAQKVQS